MLSKTLSFVLILISWSSQAFEIGVATHFTRYSEQPDFYLGLIKNHSFTSFRDGFSWASIEISPGQFEISPKNKSLDQLYLNSNSPAVKNSIFVLGYGNKNYTSSGYPRTKEEVDRFVDYVSWVVERYKGKIKYYEVWNEWFLGTGMPRNQKKPPDELYLYLVSQSAKKIKSIDPSAVVLTGSINPIHQDEKDWIFSLAEKGILNYVDGLSIHPYSFNERDKSLREPTKNIELIDGFEGELKKIVNKPVDIYITEMGYPTSKYVAGGIESKKASDYILQYTLLTRSRAYIHGIWWYDLIDDGDSLFNKEHNFGLFEEDNKPKNSAREIKKIIPILLDNNYKFQGDGDTVRVYSMLPVGSKKLYHVFNVNDSFNSDTFLNNVPFQR